MAKLILQKVFDVTAGYVYYEKDVVDATPSPGETTPNHTNSLVAGTHQIVSTRDDSSIEKYAPSIQTPNATPVILWTDPLAVARLVVLEALIGAKETGIGRADYRHFKIVASNFVDSEATWGITTTEVSAAGTGGSSTWTAQFILTSDVVELQVVGDASITVNWAAEITVRT